MKKPIICMFLLLCSCSPAQQAAFVGATPACVQCAQDVIRAINTKQRLPCPAEPAKAP